MVSGKNYKPQTTNYKLLVVRGKNPRPTGSSGRERPETINHKLLSYPKWLHVNTSGLFVVHCKQTLCMDQVRNRSTAEKTIVITGASSGAGRAMAIELAREGATLVLAARREEALQEVVAECEGLGAKAVAVPTDVRHADSLRELARSAYHFGGAIDVWINNAGVLAGGAL